MQTKVKRSTVIAVSVLLCGAVLALWVWNVQMWKGQRMLSEACSAARVFVYDHLEECGQAFANYAATGDGSYLDQAQQAAAKTAAACYAWGERIPIEPIMIRRMRRFRNGESSSWSKRRNIWRDWTKPTFLPKSRPCWMHWPGSFRQTMRAGSRLCRSFGMPLTQTWSMVPCGLI